MPSNRANDVALWIAQALLALFFVAAGVTHGMLPLEVVVKTAPWVADLPAPFVRVIGYAELAGGIAVVLPGLAGTLQGLVALSALCLAVLMLCAAVFHISRGETGIIAMHLLVAALALVVAWGRRRQRGES